MTEHAATTSPARAAARRLTGPMTAALAAAGSLGYVGLVDPNVAGNYPVCPSLQLFGVLCPFCGGLRGAHALAEGDLAAMVSSNALLPVLVVAAAWAWLSWTSDRLGGSWRVRPAPWSNRIAAGVAVLAVLYGVLRNVPWEPFTLLAP